MPRQPRFLPPGYYFHIMARGNNKAPIFSCDADYQYYLAKVFELKQEHPFDLYHYCLMPNHLHHSIRTEKRSDFSTFMKRLHLIYYHYFNRNYGFTGYFWQGRFKSQLIDNNPYFIQCGKYIELNPVRSGLADKPEDYAWSSYCYYAKGEKDPLITPDMFYEELGHDDTERQKQYSEMAIDTSITNLLHQKKALAVGEENFQRNIKRKLDYHTDHKSASYRKKRS